MKIRWCYFFKHAHDDIEELIASSSDVIKKAYDQLYSHDWTEEELLAYEEVEKANLDAETREDYVLEQGKQEGIQLEKRAYCNQYASGELVHRPYCQSNWFI